MMFNWFRSNQSEDSGETKSREQWGLVRTIELQVNITDTEHTGTVYFHLSESSKNQRKVDIVPSASISEYVSQER